MKIITTQKDGLTYYELTNQLGATLSLCDYGARLIGFEVPVGKKRIPLVVSGVTRKDFEGPSIHFGPTVGRVAGRIGGGEITIDGKNYPLPKNNGENTLHGGPHSFDSQIFASQKNEETGQVTFSYHSPHLENGFPGNLDLDVVYTLKDDANTYTIEYFAKTDAKTVFNPTNHGYYNLTGKTEETIGEHLLYVNAPAYLELAEDSIPTGKTINVKGTSMDFTTEKPLKETFEATDAQIKLVNGIDHPFVFDKAPHELRLVSPNGQITLTVTTDRDSVVLFTSNFNHNMNFSNKTVVPHGAIAIEAQNLPDAMHHEGFGNVYLNPDEKFYSKTSYEVNIKD